MKKILLFILFFILFFPVVYSQDIDEIVVLARIEGNDTIIMMDLPEYCITSRMPRKLKTTYHKRSKLIYNVKKAYPYAKLAGMKLNEYEVILKNASTDQERKKLMKRAEQELKDEFEDDIKKLTFKQGIILIKLVDRETGDSSYALIQELRGKFTAFFWQTFARIFGYNLKTEYDPEGDDKEIEEIVVMIENGQL